MLRLEARLATRLRRTILLALALASAPVLAAPAHAARCAKSYSYAGVVSARSAHGVRATIEALSVPRVSSGHVAGWVGVGGVGAGPHGETEWIQVGYSGLYGGKSQLYYEVTPPNGRTRYIAVDPDLEPGERHTVAVHEMQGRRDWWRVRVDGRSVGVPVHLPGSHGRWRPVATAESWNAGNRSCNGFAYRFSHVGVALRPNSRWRPFEPGYKLEDPGYRVARARAGFVASAR
ncbi:MAG: hypothetical protein M3327_14320 [Actinomycetota bacterium]|nr:hypothetical protein [Actinomycetota bacterium]